MRSGLMAVMSEESKNLSYRRLNIQDAFPNAVITIRGSTRTKFLVQMILSRIDGTTKYNFLGIPLDM
jgi:hypothetical protein